mmetsp:Transcript_82871/g.235075  ORF Transcript_82871/g.235075 Transcript_82871/m.235075 type:complete len:265 (-) Transcript_82871:282-1076(-)
MHRASSTSVLSSTSPLPPKYFTSKAWPVRCARRKHTNIVIFVMCLATAGDTHMSALSFAWKSLTTRRNLSTRKTRTTRTRRAPPTMREWEERARLSMTMPTIPRRTSTKSNTFQLSLKYFSRISESFRTHSTMKKIMKRHSMTSHAGLWSLAPRKASSTAMKIVLQTIMTVMDTLKIVEFTILDRRASRPAASWPMMVLKVLVGLTFHQLASSSLSVHGFARSLSMSKSFRSSFARLMAIRVPVSSMSASSEPGRRSPACICVQ